MRYGVRANTAKNSDIQRSGALGLPGVPSIMDAIDILPKPIDVAVKSQEGSATPFYG